MKNNIVLLSNPAEMPQSVKTSILRIWKDKIPENIANICYTYGVTCFSPRELTKDLIVHESVHTEQQGRDGLTPDSWWDKYGVDILFRYEQELEAYRAQYKYILANHNKAVAFNCAKRFASDMSSPMYGNMCTFNQALQDILRK